MKRAAVDVAASLTDVCVDISEKRIDYSSHLLDGHQLPDPNVVANALLFDFDIHITPF